MIVFNLYDKTFGEIRFAYTKPMKGTKFYLVHYGSYSAFVDETKLIFVDEDTPQNRLQIQLKYS
jgi:hypothetical protein